MGEKCNARRVRLTHARNPLIDSLYSRREFIVICTTDQNSSLFENQSTLVTKHLIISSFLCMWVVLNLSYAGHAQAASDSSSAVKQRLIPLTITGTTLYTGSLVVLSTQWYQDFDRNDFHFFNDGDQWLQMDKAGHGLTAYYINELATRALKYSGVKNKRALLLGAGVSFSYLACIEVLDGFSAKWGYSVSDMIANTSGIALYTGQELLWEEQRIRFKYNFLPSEFAAYRPDALGVGFWQQALKDYNGQAYWLSTNPQNWMDAGRWPRWLNVCVGYSASGMTGGRENSFPLLNSGESEPDFARTREFYLSLDLNLDGISSKNKAFNAFRRVFSFVKIPAPALSVNSQGQFSAAIR